MTLLPTELSKIVTNLDNEKMLWYGEPGVGKSTTANQDGTLFLATDPGHSKMNCFKVEIDSWNKFGQVYKELHEGKHKFKRICIDTVSVLHLLCSRAKCERLGIEHESDLDWGKGWSIVNKAFEKAIQGLSLLNVGVIFIDHEQTKEISEKTGKLRRQQPGMNEKASRIVCGYVDHIMRFAIEDDPEVAGKEKRIIQVEPSKYYISKSRGDRGVSIFSKNMDMSWAAIKAEYDEGIAKLLKTTQTKMEAK